MALPLDQAKTARNAAHEIFEAQLAQVQEDLAARGIGGRIADRAGEVAAQTAEVASEHKGVIAGTFAAIALWIFRDPIIRLVDRLRFDAEETERNSEHD